MAEVLGRLVRWCHSKTARIASMHVDLMCFRTNLLQNQPPGVAAQGGGWRCG